MVSWRFLDNYMSIQEASLPRLLSDSGLLLIKSLDMLYGSLFGLAEMGTGGSTQRSSGVSLLPAKAAMVAPVA
jgi:hypothetical protein